MLLLLKFPKRKSYVKKIWQHLYFEEVDARLWGSSLTSEELRKDFLPGSQKATGVRVLSVFHGILTFQRHPASHCPHRWTGGASGEHLLLVLLEGNKSDLVEHPNEEIVDLMVDGCRHLDVLTVVSLGCWLSLWKHNSINLPTILS